MVKVAIAGVTGYSGEELVKILAHHPQAKIVYVSAKQERACNINRIYPYLQNVLDLECKVWDAQEACRLADVVFLALPHSVSMASVPALLAAGKKVVDISADYRFPSADDYPRVYGFDHTDAEGLAKAVYGLPEKNRELIKKANLIANPGCYPTAAILGLLPLAKKGIEAGGAIVVDAKSGVTGAGRKASKALLHPEVQENFKAYKVLKHAHEEEIRIHLDGSPKLLFVPHLLPVRKGILSTIYFPLPEGITGNSVRQAYVDFYAKEPFVQVLPEGEFPELSHVRDTNQCHIGIGIKDKTRTAVIVTAIDNLQKGASGQAVQNMNLMCGLPEEEGLR